MYSTMLICVCVCIAKDWTRATPLKEILFMCVPLPLYEMVERKRTNT